MFEKVFDDEFWLISCQMLLKVATFLLQMTKTGDWKYLVSSKIVAVDDQSDEKFSCLTDLTLKLQALQKDLG